MNLRLLPSSALDIISSCLTVASEDSQILCAQGRVAIALRLWSFLRRAKLAFEELWERRDAIEFMEWDWSAGNSPRSPGEALDGYWSDGDFAQDDDWRWDY